MCKPGYTEIPQSKQSGCAAADVAERTERRKPGDYGGQDIAGPVFTENMLQRRFLRAVSCKGRVRLAGTLRELCPRAVMLSDEGLEHAARTAEENGLSAIVCPQPLRPDKLDAVLLPERSLAFVSRAWERESTESIEAESENEYAPMLDELLGAACAQLAKAKGMHDELERVYRPYMDFAALTEYTERVISSLLD